MYDLLINDEPAGAGLSLGELNQWLIDLHNELKGKAGEAFKSQLGFPKNKTGSSKDSFEDYLYNTELNTPLILNHNEDLIRITKAK